MTGFRFIMAQAVRHRHTGRADRNLRNGLQRGAGTALPQPRATFPPQSPVLSNAPFDIQDVDAEAVLRPGISIKMSALNKSVIVLSSTQ